jgi:hypothetical protein
VIDSLHTGSSATNPSPTEALWVALGKHYIRRVTQSTDHVWFHDPRQELCFLQAEAAQSPQLDILVKTLSSHEAGCNNDQGLLHRDCCSCRVHKRVQPDDM